MFFAFIPMGNNRGIVNHGGRAMEMQNDIAQWCIDYATESSLCRFGAVNPPSSA